MAQAFDVTDLPPPSQRGRSAAGVWIRLARTYSAVLREVRSAMGDSTTLPQFDVLAQLARHPNGMTMGELSRTLLVTAGNVTGIVTRLESRGLVTRRARPDDRRVRVLQLTAAGKRFARAEIERHERMLEQILAEVPVAQRAELNAALDGLKVAVEQRASEDDE